MKNLKTTTLLACAMLGMGAAGSVQADLFATAYLSIENLEFLGSDGNILDASTDFNALAFTSSADYDGTLTGAGSFGDVEPNGGNIDFTSQCLTTTGDCPVLVENQQPPTLISGPQGTDFVTADQYQDGAPIANLDNVIDGTGNFTTGANILSITTANLSATEAEGSANVNNGLESSWTFSLAGAGAITIAADNLSVYLEAFASAGELFPGKASASTSFIITITDINGSTIFEVEVFNDTTSASANGWPFDIQTCGGLFDQLGSCGVALSIDDLIIVTPVLAADTFYQLSIRGNSNIDIARVQEVPEPGILALLGMGMMGMFLTRRRG